MTKQIRDIIINGNKSIEEIILERKKNLETIKRPMTVLSKKYEYKEGIYYI